MDFYLLVSIHYSMLGQRRYFEHHLKIWFCVGSPGQSERELEAPKYLWDFFTYFCCWLLVFVKIITERSQITKLILTSMNSLLNMSHRLLVIILSLPVQCLDDWMYAAAVDVVVDFFGCNWPVDCIFDFVEMTHCWKTKFENWIVLGFEVLVFELCHLNHRRTSYAFQNDMDEVAFGAGAEI